MDIEVLCISSNCDVFPCLLVSEFPAPDVPLTDTGCMCVPCGPQRFVSQFEESSCHASSTQISLKERDVGAPQWIEQLGSDVQLKLTEGLAGLLSPTCCTTLAEEKVRWSSSAIVTLLRLHWEEGGRRTMPAIVITNGTFFFSPRMLTKHNWDPTKDLRIPANDNDDFLAAFFLKLFW